MTEQEKYYAKCVIKARDGSREAELIIHRNIDNVPVEILEWCCLTFDNYIRVGSTAQKRLNELTAKYETPEVLATEIW